MNIEKVAMNTMALFIKPGQHFRPLRYKKQEKACTNTQRQTGVYKLQEKITLKVSVYFRCRGLDIHRETDEEFLVNHRTIH